MENKARKMFAAVVVIMLCAVAIVGIGYAYQATTTNTNNSTTADYITVTPRNVDDTANSFSGDLADYGLVFNTVTNSDSTVTYTLEATESTAKCVYIKGGAVVTDPAGATSVYKIGTQIIKLNHSSGTVPTFNLTVTETAGTLGTGYDFYVGVGTGIAPVDHTEAPTGYSVVQLTSTPPKAVFSSVTGGEGTVTLYVELFVTVSTPTTTAPTADVLDGVSFEYKAEVTPS